MTETKILIKDQVRAYVSDVTSIAQEAIHRHKTLPLASLALSTAIAVFGPLSAMKKYGKTIANLKGNGPLKNIIVESNVNGEIRALVGNPFVVTEFDNSRFNEIPIELGIGSEGTLKITHEVNDKTFGGQIKLVKGNITTDLAYYFDQSEQIYSAVQSSVILDEQKRVKKAFSVIFQLLPKHNENDVKLVEHIIKDHRLNQFESIDEYIKKTGFNLLETINLKWQCNCSKEKTRSILASLSAEEKQDIITKHHKLEVACNFCNEIYDFTNEYKNNK